ncbi:hypothetical protein ETAA8_07340 [Anatilimnocola aggregata]|uniref:YetF C-terminal domain-containing protein n=1 Tax=Anatilimnocola aggregata TaxID=2528021 RepID=A0A517Y5Z7_9BACT|nr:YetF domain-containing protein [Anatilimnocola aggregata]QDU25664.1 hypothetical protein ETAA8_07340 [Anatilimnocola aggregata]
MWELSQDQPWWTFVIRAAVVFGFVLLLLRISGKRQIGQMTPFDLVLLLLISNAVQNSMNGGDNTITAGVILAATLMGIDAGLGWLAFRSRKVEQLLEGRPVILIHGGKIDHRALAEVQMTQHDLQAAIRAAGHTGPEEIRYAVLETNGHVSVIPLEKSDSGGDNQVPAAKH